MIVTIQPEAYPFIDLLQLSNQGSLLPENLNKHLLNFLYIFLETHLTALNIALAHNIDTLVEKRVHVSNLNGQQIEIEPRMLSNLLDNIISLDAPYSLRQEANIFQLVLAIHSRILTKQFRGYRSDSPYFVMPLFYTQNEVLNFTSGYLLASRVTKCCQLPKTHLLSWLKSQGKVPLSRSFIIEDTGESYFQTTQITSPIAANPQIVNSVKEALNHFVRHREIPFNFHLEELANHPQALASAVYSTLESVTPPKGTLARLEVDDLPALFFYELAMTSINKQCSDWVYFMAKSFANEISDFANNFKFEGTKEFQVKIYQFNCMGYLIAAACDDLSCHAIMDFAQWLINSLDSTAHLILMLSLFNSIFKKLNHEALELFEQKISFVYAFFSEIFNKLSDVYTSDPSLLIMYMSLDPYNSRQISGLAKNTIKRVVFPQTFQPFSCTQGTLKYIAPELAFNLLDCYSKETTPTFKEQNEETEQIQVIIPTILEEDYTSNIKEMLLAETEDQVLTPDRFENERRLRRDPDNFVQKLDESDRNDIENIALTLRTRLMAQLKSRISPRKITVSVVQSPNFVDQLKIKVRKRLENGVKVMLIDYGTNYEEALVSVYTDKIVKRIISDLVKYIKNLGYKN